MVVKINKAASPILEGKFSECLLWSIVGYNLHVDLYIIVGDCDINLQGDLFQETNILFSVEEHISLSKEKLDTEKSWLD